MYTPIFVIFIIPEFRFFGKFEDLFDSAMFNEKHKKNAREPLKKIVNSYFNLYLAKLIIFHAFTMLIIFIISWVK